jgi:hypothetical protein
MTASKTPNLGLMNPVGSDDFEVTDFSTTFGIIDQNPGILTVPNQASRPSGWGSAQNGRRVWQADQNIEWVWSQPSPSFAGVWQRTYPKGWLAGQGGGAASTGNTTFGQGPVVLSVTTLVPGGRPVAINYNFYQCINETTGTTIVSIWENGVMIGLKYHYGRLASQPLTYSLAGMMYYYRNPAPTTQQTVNYQLQINAENFQPANAGVSSISDAHLDIYET